MLGKTCLESLNSGVITEINQMGTIFSLHSIVDDKNDS